jgi:hypothetical protein
VLCLNNENSKKKKKFFLTNDFTHRGLSLLLIFSFTATIIAFAVAYCEHRNYTALITKYDEALERIDNCEASISALMTSQPDNIYTTGHNQTTPSVTQAPTVENDSSDNQEVLATQQTSGNEAVTTQKTETPSGYYVTQSGKKYHIASCSYLSKSKVAISLERISAEGYSPCSRCIK